MVRRARRGVTLVEMLVTVALLLLVMTIIVAIFREATGAVSSQQAYAAIEGDLRRIETVIRQDLQGITARLTPPLDPSKNLGYFTYEENELADLQGEDVDDVIAFTTKAPPGKPFVGRVWVAKSNTSIGGPAGFTPRAVLVTSDTAEVIYFVRNGNLHRRVLLVLPDRADTLGIVRKPGQNPNLEVFRVTNVDQGANQPSDYGAPGDAPGFRTDMFGTGGFVDVGWLALNDISARPRKLPIFDRIVPQPNTLGDLTDRQNRFAHPRFYDDFFNNATGAAGSDGIPDDSNGDDVPDYYPTLYPNVVAAGLVGETQFGVPASRDLDFDLMAFPFVYPYAYSRAPVGQGPGLFHESKFLDPTLQLRVINHSPLDIGESRYPFQADPNAAPVWTVMPTPQPNEYSTWWGRPTWKETVSPSWDDPAFVPNPAQRRYQPFCLSRNGGRALPPVPGLPFSDGAGSTNWWPASYTPDTLAAIWEDDLILAGVRSFDVKAYDEAASNFGLPKDYYDLGYGSRYDASLLTGTSPFVLNSFCHEGRIPPLVEDNRVDAQYPIWGIGDNNPNVVRLRRVFDTWSTTYTQAPAKPYIEVDAQGNPLTPPIMGLEVDQGLARPVYPSYPPPYPVSLKGIQIQIRVTDPQNQRLRTLTIRHDFADKQ